MSEMTPAKWTVDKVYDMKGVYSYGQTQQNLRGKITVGACEHRRSQFIRLMNPCLYNVSVCNDKNVDH